MKNFFHHLVERSLGSVPAAIQPKLPSRYDSPPREARFVEERAEIVVPQPTVPGAAAPARSAAPPPYDGGVPSTPPAAPSFSPLALERTISSKSAPAAAVAPSPPPAASRETIERTATVVPAAIVSQGQASLPAAAGAAPVYQQIVTREITERIREIQIQPKATEARTPFHSRDPIAMVPIPQPPPSVIPLRERLAALAGAEVGAAAFEATAAPTIRVSIGRIDIRAVHPPARPPAPAPKPIHRPALSLEAYLSRRAAL